MPLRLRRTTALASLITSVIIVPCTIQRGAAQTAQPQALIAEAALPEAPDPQLPASSQEPRHRPCPVKSKTAPSTPPATTAAPSTTTPAPPADNPCESWLVNRYRRFVNGPQDKPLTPRDKAWLAARNLVDPFNAITILGDAGIAVGSDSHSDYGPGMPGFARYVGVSFTQDLTGEFFGTFLIPSVVHQDPHYHRMPEAKIPRRIFHSVAQVYWTQGDNGRGMINYANLAGFAIDDEISNLYVPDRETNAAASAQRYFIGLATAPIGNIVAEFLPDVARHIHVQIFVIQRIINNVAKVEPAGQ